MEWCCRMYHDKRLYGSGFLCCCFTCGEKNFPADYADLFFTCCEKGFATDFTDEHRLKIFISPVVKWFATEAQKHRNILPADYADFADKKMTDQISLFAAERYVSYGA